MDSTKNEVDGLTVNGFPTLKFFPKGSDKVSSSSLQDRSSSLLHTPSGTRLYSGGRTLEDLIKYVEKRVDGTATDDDEGGEEQEPAEGEDEAPEEDQGEDGAGQELRSHQVQTTLNCSIRPHPLLCCCTNQFIICFDSYCNT